MIDAIFGYISPIVVLILAAVVLAALPFTWIIWLFWPIRISRRPILGTIRMMSGFAGLAVIAPWVKVFQEIATLSIGTRPQQFLGTIIHIIVASSVFLVATDNIHAAIAGDSYIKVYRNQLYIISVAGFAGMLLYYVIL